MKLCIECERPAFALDGLLCAECDSMKPETGRSTTCTHPGCGLPLGRTNKSMLCEKHRRSVRRKARRQGRCRDCGTPVWKGAARCHVHAAIVRWAQLREVQHAAVP